MKTASRIRRHLKIRKKVLGTAERPRLSVSRSNKHIFAQIIDDVSGKTLAACGDFGFKGKKSEHALEVGRKIANLALKKKIKAVVFDRGGFLYHGRVKKLAEEAREGGLKF